jgi:hypothetical protein
MDVSCAPKVVTVFHLSVAAARARVERCPERQRTDLTYEAALKGEMAELAKKLDEHKSRTRRTKPRAKPRARRTRPRARRSSWS